MANGRVYFGTTAGKVHVLDAATGRIAASIDVGSPVTGALTFANDSLYFQDLGAKVVRMNPAGKVLWEYDHYATYRHNDPRFEKDSNSGQLASEKPMYGGGEVAVRGNRLLVSLGWDVFCLDVSDGSVNWWRPVGMPAGQYPVLTDGVVAFASIAKGEKAPVIQAWDALSGAERWRFRFSEYKESPNASGCVLDGTMYFSCGSNKEPGTTVALDPPTGNVLWKNEYQFCEVTR